MTEEKITLLYDIEQMRPGCVMIQAAFGGDSWALRQFFSSDDWLVSLTPTMRRYTGTTEEWQEIGRRTAERNK